MRMNAKELIASARVTAPTLPPAAAKLMTAMANRLDVQFVALCESRNEAKQLAAENAARGEIIERLIGQYSCAGLDAVQGSFHPGQSLLYDAMQVMKSNAGESAVARLRAEAVADAMPEGYVPMPKQIHLDADAVECICSQGGDGGFAYGDFTDVILWVGEVENDDGSKTHGLNVSSADYPEEGSINLCEFAAQLRSKSEVPS